MHEMIFLLCFTTNSNSIYFLGGSVHIKMVLKSLMIVPYFSIGGVFCTRIYRIQHIIHHSHPVVLHSFRHCFFRHCLIPFSSYKRTTVCSTSGRRIWGIFSSCLNTRGICRPTFAGFCDTRSTSLQSGLDLLSDQAEPSEPAEPVVACPCPQGISSFGMLYYFCIACILEQQQEVHFRISLLCISLICISCIAGLTQYCQLGSQQRACHFPTKH